MEYLNINYILFSLIIIFLILYYTLCIYSDEKTIIINNSNINFLSHLEYLKVKKIIEFKNITLTLQINYISYIFSFEKMYNNSIVEFHEKDKNIKGTITFKDNVYKVNGRSLEKRILIIKTKNNIFDILNFVNYYSSYNDKNNKKIISMDGFFHKDKKSIFNILNSDNKNISSKLLILHGKSHFYKMNFINILKKEIGIKYDIIIDLCIPYDVRYLRTCINNPYHEFMKTTMNTLIIVKNFKEYIDEYEELALNFLSTELSLCKNLKFGSTNIIILFLVEDLNFSKPIYDKFIKSRLLSPFQFDFMDFNSFNELCKYYFNKEAPKDKLKELKIKPCKIYDILQNEDNFDKFINKIISENEKII